MISFGGLTAHQIETRFKEGRGSGAGKNYKPFLTVRDVSSLGRSHRVFGFKTQRMHHLLSDLELSVFLTLDWQETTTDIREQFPLNVDKTTQISEEAGIRHAAFRGAYQVMTSDFLVDTNSKDHPQFALQVKYAKDLEDKRTIEKLELERRYWRSKGIPWFIVTENDICRDTVKNIEWFAPVMNDPIDFEGLYRFCSLFEKYFQDYPEERLGVLATMLDRNEDLEQGAAMFWLRHLLARRYFIFNIAKPYRSLTGNEVIKNETIPMMEAYNAAG